MRGSQRSGRFRNMKVDALDQPLEQLAWLGGAAAKTDPAPGNSDLAASIGALSEAV